MGQPGAVTDLNFMIGQMDSGIIQMQSVSLFWIQMENLGEFLLQTV
jgi:hypothetical protein